MQQRCLAGRGRLVSAARASASLPLHHGAAALAQVLCFDLPADTVLARYWREHRAAGRRERDFVRQLVYGVLRQLASLRAQAGAQADDARALMLLWLHGQGQSHAALLAQACSADEQCWLAERAAAPVALSAAAQNELPQWLYDALLAQYGAEELSLLAQDWRRDVDSVDIRVNTLKARPQQVQQALQAQGLACERSRWSPCGLRLAGKPKLQGQPLFAAGQFEIQDEGSQLVSFLLAPRRDQALADFCAGAGGKTLHLGAMMQDSGKIYAFDVAEKRLAILRQRAARAGLGNIHSVCLAHENDTRLQRFDGKMAGVLVDAPCSGLGTVRRTAELKWRHDAAAIERFAQRQQAILQAAARLVAVGGRLVYATCSILAAENEAVARAFDADTQTRFQPLHVGEILQAQKIKLDSGPYLRLLPHRHGSDGFFAAVWQRVA